MSTKMASLCLHSARFRVRHDAVAHKFNPYSYPPLLPLTSDLLAEREVYT